MACVRVIAPESIDRSSATPALLGRMSSTAKIARACREADDITLGADFCLVGLIGLGDTNVGAVSAMG